MPDDVKCHVGMTSANMLADSFGHQEKTATLWRNFHGNGVIWCEKVKNMVLYMLIHVCEQFFS